MPTSLRSLKRHSSSSDRKRNAQDDDEAMMAYGQVQEPAVSPSRSPPPAERSHSYSYPQPSSNHRVLSPQTRSEIIQRPRGSTLPSYMPENSRPKSPGKYPFQLYRERSHLHSKDQVSSHPPPESTRHITQTNGSLLLPPIRVSLEQPQKAAFGALPPIKPTLMSPTHMVSLDSRSPTSPTNRYPLALAKIAPARTSQVQTSVDLTGRFHRE